MIDDKYPEKLGKLLSNLLSVEFGARLFLAKKDGNEQFPSDDAKIGDAVLENPLTNFDQLNKVLNKYNQNVNDEHKVNINSLVKLRHGLAHGRILAKLNEPYKLYKFTQAEDGYVRITHLELLNDEWFLNKMKLAADAATKIRNAINAHFS